jgi:superfamily II DNA or RNA helicase
VYARIECEPSTAMEIAERFTFMVPGAKFSPMYKNKLWDGKIRIFNPMNRLLYIGLIPELENLCNSRKYHIEYEIENADIEFSLHEAEKFVKALEPKYEPRDYQYEAFVHAIRKRRALLLSPTGSGKSLIIYMLACYYQSKTLIVVPTTSLVHQMASDFEDYGFPKKLIHKIMSGEEKETDAPYVISTWQSIFKMPKPWFKQFKVVIGDEAHLFKAKSLTAIMTKLDECKYRFGFTGTLDGTQTNKLILEGLFGPVKRVAATSELIEQKYLSDLKIKSCLLKHPDETKKLLYRSEYQDEMDFLVKCEKRNRFIVNLALSLKGNSMVLFQYVEKHGKVLYDMLTKEAPNVKIYFISGGIDSQKREEIRKILETEQNAILVASYGTSSTGLNIRNLSNVIFASPSKSLVRVLQSIGRVLRMTESKDVATLFDIGDDISWKSRKNYTLNHYNERLEIYNKEKFSYKKYDIQL